MDSDKIADIYMDFRNNFLTESAFADHYALTGLEAGILLTLAKSLHNARAERLKALDASRQQIKTVSYPAPEPVKMATPEEIEELFPNSPNFKDTVITLINDLENQEKGRVIFTLIDKRVNHRKTFKVSKTDFANGAIVVSLLTGSDNENDYTSFGFLDLVTKDVRLWNRFKYTSAYIAYGKVLRDVFFDFDEEKFRVVHAGKCFKCGRTLTTPESIESGIGPVCASMD